MIAKAIDKINKESMKQEPLSFKIGDSVRVHVKIKEGDKERVQVFAGTVSRATAVRPPPPRSRCAASPSASASRRSFP